MVRHVRFLFIAIGLLIAAVALGAIFLVHIRESAVPVSVGEARKGEMLITISAASTGSIESERKITISGQAMGKLRRFFVEEGEWVSKGQLIAQLEEEEAEIRLKLAEANLEAAQVRLRRAEGDGAGREAQITPYASPTPSEGTEAEETTQVSSSQDLLSLEAPEKGDSAWRGDPPVTQEVAAARAGFKQMEAICDLARLQLDRTQIRSPFAGVLSERMIREGELVGVGTPICSLFDPRRIFVRATIDEYDARRLRVGQKALISIEALREEAFEGRVYHIAPLVSGGKLEARAIAVKISCEGTPPVRMGMSADIEIVVAKLNDVLYIPSLAAVEREGGHHSLVVEGGRVRLRPIQVGDANWSYVMIKSGLHPGDQVVLNPDLSKLKEGQRVRVEAAP